MAVVGSVQFIVLVGVEPLQNDGVGAAAGQSEANAGRTIKRSVFQQ